MAKTDKSDNKFESLDDLKKLSPEQRIAKLKEFEERKKKEVQEAEHLLKETIKQVETDKKSDDVLTFQTLRDKIMPLDQILELERRAFEEAASQKEPTPEEQDVIQYNISKEVKQIYTSIQNLGYTSDWGKEEAKKFEKFGDRLSQIVENYQLTKDVANQVMVSQSLVDNVKQYMSGHNESANVASDGYQTRHRNKQQYLS